MYIETGVLTPIKMLCWIHAQHFFILIYVTSFSNISFNSLCLTFFGIQQLTNGLDIEGDLMQFNTYENILYEV